MSTPKRRRVIIIGGGPSAMTTAYWLTSTEALRAQYEVTVYQMGWRLGGKGASGRNAAQGERIEEHGLHIMFGFYQNFFSMIREVYAALGRPKGAPLATWRQAFHPLTSGVMEDKFRGRWHPWIELFPRNTETPGSGGALNGPLDYLLMLLQGLLSLLLGWKLAARAQGWFFPSGAAWESEPDRVRPESTWGTKLLFGALDLFLRGCAWVHRHLRPVAILANALYEALWWLLQPLVRRSSRVHRMATGLDCLVAVFRGAVVDRLFEANSYAPLDQWDFRDWVAARGAHEETKWSPYVRAIYDAAFSYSDGKSTEQRISASVALRTLVRMVFSYKGAIYYKMQSGMGDTIFGPLYEVLKARGVHFKFFHKARALNLDARGQSIASVDFEVQALMKQEGADYQPLRNVAGLPSWPSEPLYNQIQDPDRIRGVDLESYYSGYEGVDKLHLEAGRDFDLVLLGTPVQTLPFLCAELPRWNEPWRRMIQEVKAVQTLSFQVWMKSDTAQLGWAGPPLPLLSLFVQPYNTWSDMSQVLPCETWPAGHVPSSVQYFTGAQPGPDMPPPQSDHDFPVRMKQNAYSAALDFMYKHFTTLMPQAAGAAPAVDWSQLVCCGDQPSGPARLTTQYWRTNCEPHERCTLALPRTGAYRLKAGETGYDNLVITGDWIDNGIHVACLEGSVMAGIYSARAVTGQNFPIIGEMMNGSIFGQR